MNEKPKTGFVVAAYIQPVLKAFLKQGGHNTHKVKPRGWWLKAY